MRIGIATAVYKRQEVFRLWAANTKAIFPDAVVSVAYSEKEYKKVINHHGFIPVYAPNKPLGNKFNIAVEQLKNYGVTHILTTGSDDVSSDGILKFYHKHLSNYEYIGFKDCYFYDLESQTTRYWKGYRGRRENEPIGAGKLVTRDLIEKLCWKPFGVVERGLDHYYHNNLLRLGAKTLVASLVDQGLYLVDIKTDENMSSFDRIYGKEVGEEWMEYTPLR